MRHIQNLIASAVVALAVSATVSPAAAPLANEAPSKTDRITSLAKRVDALQIRLSDTREIAKQARDEAEDATNVTSCITTGIWVATDPDSGYLVEGDGTEPDAVIAATLDADCTDAS